MSWISDIFSGGTEGTVKGILGGVGDFAKAVREAITGEAIKDPNKVLELQQKAMEIEFAVTKTQTDINLEEAKNPNVFVSGWRPFIGWICGTGLAFQFIISPMTEWICKLFGKAIVPPTLDTGSLMSLIVPLLGLGAYRTYEKVKSAQSNH